MDLTDFKQKDPHMLVGLVNTELRNHAADLVDLCKTHGIDEEGLKAKLAAAGYAYIEEQKQFR